jgi:hypothetical protein
LIGKHLDDIGQVFALSGELDDGPLGDFANLYSEGRFATFLFEGVELVSLSDIFAQSLWIFRCDYR